MRKVIGSIVFVLGGMLSTAGCAEPFDPAHTVVIDKPIATATMKEVTKQMDGYLTAARPPKQVSIILDSPGGSVSAGFKFIAQMKALQGKGTKISCYVPGMAASMAFHILTHCSERVVLQESALLWHRARVFVFMAVVTAPQAAVLSRDLNQIDQHILADVKDKLVKDMSLQDISYHFEHETMHIGQSLCESAPSFCTAKASVPGLIEALRRAQEAEAKRSEGEEQEPQDIMLFTGADSIVYISSEYLDDMIEQHMGE